jgi:hypothetical protein
VNTAHRLLLQAGALCFRTRCRKPLQLPANRRAAQLAGRAVGRPCSNRTTGIQPNRYSRPKTWPPQSVCAKQPLPECPSPNSAVSTSTTTQRYIFPFRHRPLTNPQIILFFPLYLPQEYLHLLTAFFLFFRNSRLTAPAAISTPEQPAAAFECRSRKRCRYLKNAAALKLATGPYKVNARI